ncbi:MAG: type IV toxin-antitoxin system AbiEi family antitoxin domain-containing protein [Planctomycetota bacterium]|jgi:predicted transcriptional regulator of viral defense system
MANSRISIAKPDIVQLFEEYPKKVLRLPELQQIFHDNRRFWRLAHTMTRSEFVAYLLKNTKLKKHSFNFPSRGIVRYTWGPVAFYELLLSLKPNSYLTHYSAMYFHELTDQVPKTVYVNFEQKPHARPGAPLTQESIDRAFKAPTRMSKTIARYKDRTITLLNGMFTGSLGVTNLSGPDGETVRITDPERTLIDITVRPEYSGGVFQVLKAYQLAKPKVSINRLAANLKRMDYVYPYYQAIGFYLERAGVYTATQIDLLRKFDFRYDFYLLHAMTDYTYSERWRLYYPKSLA